jgi:predicted MFS family arabinose efflux permease
LPPISTLLAFDGRARDEWRRHWPVVLAGAAGMALASAPPYTMGVMLRPLEHEFGWSRAAISSGPMISAIAAVPLGTLLGWAVDRFGPRRIAVVGVLITCLSLGLLATTTASIWSWWALWSLIALTCTLVKPTVWAAGVSSYFTSTRGLALAAMLCGTAVCSTLTPTLTNYLIDQHGWRATYLILAVIWTVLVFPPVLFLFNSAADQQRGRDLATRTRSAAAVLSGMDARPALTSWRYVRLSLASVTMVMATVTCVVSLVPILISLGHAPARAAELAGLIGVTTVIGRLIGGHFLDRMNAHVVAACTITLPVAAALILLLAPPSIPAAAAAVMILGLSMGAELDAVAYLTTRHFGLRSFGVLFGTIGGLQALATGLGPLLINAIYDATRSYDLALWLFIPMCLAGAGLFLSLGPFPEFETPQDAEAAAAAAAA